MTMEFGILTISTKRHLNTWLPVFVMIMVYLTSCWTAVTQSYQQANNEQQFLTSLSLQNIHWGHYGTWSICSKTCGTGLESRERLCLNYLNDRIDNQYCNGSSKEYRVCRVKHCRDPIDASYRYQQCTQLDYDELRWKPFIGNAALSLDPCSLTCYAVGDHSRIEILADTVPTGTQCVGLQGTTQYQGMCVDGQCLVVGCDHLLNSTKTNDHCGVCGGDGLSCQSVSGTFIRENLQIGYTYTKVLEIPEGAMNIRIYEMERSKNYLAISDSEDTYYLNGDLNINQPGRYKIAGTMFRYQRRMVWNMGQWREEPELLIAQGPTDRVIFILVLKAESTTHIVYEYTISLATPQTHNKLHVMNINTDTYNIEDLYNANERTEGENDLPDLVTKDTEGFWEDNQGGEETDYSVTMVTIQEDADDDLFNSSSAEEFESKRFTLTETITSVVMVVDEALHDGNESVADSTSKPKAVEENENVQEQFRPLPGKIYHTDMLPIYQSSTEPSVQFKHRELSLQHSPKSRDEDMVVIVEEEHPKYQPLLHEYRPHQEDLSATLISDSSTSKPSLTTSTSKERDSNSKIMVTPPEESLLIYPTEDLPRIELSLSGTIGYQGPEDYTRDRPYANSDENTDQERNEPNIWDNVAETTDGPLSSDSDSVDSFSEYDTISPGVPPQHKPPSRGPGVDTTNEPDVPRHTYVWRKSGLAPCSSTCSRGVMSAFAFCQRDDGIQADDFNCDSATKPQLLPRQCARQQCEPRWEVGEWSQCTKSCGGGMRYRTVHCWRMLGPGLDSSIANDLCNVTDMPESTKTCADEPCGPQWQTSEWSECSRTCGNGNIMREVTCSSSRLLCNRADIPASFQPCNAGQCPTWSPGSWSRCPGPCKIQQREMQCRSRNGALLPDSACPTNPQPYSAKLCGQQNCAAQWVPQKFSLCNGTCEGAHRVRKVHCSSLRNAQMRRYEDQVCRQWNKPALEESCTLPLCATHLSQRTVRDHNQPTARWLTTEWSQCSTTCASGVRNRRVRCYLNGNLDSSCVLSERPDSQMSCVNPDCQIQSSTCGDSQKANCQLILSANLCQYQTYRNTCCITCQTGRR